MAAGFFQMLEDRGLVDKVSNEWMMDGHRTHLSIVLLQQFVSLTTDNAANNGTMIETLAKTLTNTGRIGFIDHDRVRVRCLAHIIHLAVTALLAEICGRSVDHDPELEPISVEEAENYLGDGDEASLSDRELIDEENEEDFSSSVAKVC